MGAQNEGKKLYWHFENVDFVLIKQFLCNISFHSMDCDNFIIFKGKFHCKIDPHNLIIVLYFIYLMQKCCKLRMLHKNNVGQPGELCCILGV